MIKISEEILTADELKEASGRDIKDIDIEITNVAVSKVNGGTSVALNIDAKLNSAYILIGLLWGNGDFAKTVEISCRCGQDSDCNPSSAASILGNFYGASGIPEIYKANVNYDTTLFDSTTYTLINYFNLTYRTVSYRLRNSFD